MSHSTRSEGAWESIVNEFLQTPVGMSICFMHMDPEVYPEPYRFKPERWIGSYDPRMNRNFVPFTKGSQNCLGMKWVTAPGSFLLGLSAHVYLQALHGLSYMSALGSCSVLVAIKWDLQALMSRIWSRYLIVTSGFQNAIAEDSMSALTRLPPDPMGVPWWTFPWTPSPPMGKL